MFRGSALRVHRRGRQADSDAAGAAPIGGLMRVKGDAREGAIVWPHRASEGSIMAERKGQLEDRLEELRRRLRRIEHDLEEPVSASFSEQAIEREEDEVLEDLGHAGEKEIRMIEAALARIEAGEYGACVRCGEPIAEERLDILPHTPLCRNCAR
jgi:DnaK suppressor protein